MKEHPILFSAPMVRAILDGSKTQTRRVIKPQPLWEEPPGQSNTDPQLWCGRYICGDGAEIDERTCPYGVPGDRLWIRETWAIHPRFDTILYRADSESFGDANGYGLWKPAWTPSIHMSRKLSRVDLEITAVRVERVQEISEEDIIAEGIKQKWTCLNPGTGSYAKENNIYDDFKSLWDSINGKKNQWAGNPYVWVVEFKRI